MRATVQFSVKAPRTPLAKTLLAVDGRMALHCEVV
jgi:hypothetical protein